MSPHILALDVAGAPHRWINVRNAAHYYATDMIAWAIGTHESCCAVARNARRAFSRSFARARSSRSRARTSSSATAITCRRARRRCFARDRYVCAYCAQRFRFDQLAMDHIVPSSKGGAASWMNLVTACKACNNRKANRTPEAAGMKLYHSPNLLGFLWL